MDSLVAALGLLSILSRKRDFLKRVVFAIAALLAVGTERALPQGAGSGGSISGTVTDPSGATIGGATVQVLNKVTGYDKTVTTDTTGAFRFLGLAPNNYQVNVTSPGFQPQHQDAAVRGGVPVTLSVAMKLAESNTTVDVKESAEQVESVPTPHTEVDTSQFEKLPTYSVGGGLNDVVAHSAPG